jgi:TolB-like protein
MTRSIFRWLVPLLLTSPLHAEPPAPKLLVMPLDARNGVTPDLAATLTESLAGEMRRSRKFRVTTLKEVEGVLSQAQRAQVAGCEAECAVEMGKLLQADQILSGSLGRVGSDYVLNTQRVSSMDGSPLAAATRRVPVARETALLDVLPTVAQELVEARASSDTVVAPRAVDGATQVASVTKREARGPIRLAVLPLTGRGKGRPEFDVLPQGLADVLITDLNQVEGIQVVERERLNELLTELRLQRSGAFDPATVQKVGKLLGVEYLVTGSFFDLMGTFRMDVVVVNVETGAHLAAQGVDGKAADVLLLEKQLVGKLLDSVAARVTDRDKARLNAPAPAASLQDMVAYSSAVDALDHGDKERARKGALAMLEKVPGFVAAQNLLRKTEAPR